MHELARHGHTCATARAVPDCGAAQHARACTWVRACVRSFRWAPTVALFFSMSSARRFACSSLLRVEPPLAAGAVARQGPPVRATHRQRCSGRCRTSTLSRPRNATPHAAPRNATPRGRVVQRVSRYSAANQRRHSDVVCCAQVDAHVWFAGTSSGTSMSASSAWSINHVIA